MQTLEETKNLFQKELIKNMQSEYCKLGDQIQQIFESNINSDVYTIKFTYTGYRDKSLKCDKEGEYTFYTVTNKHTGLAKTYNSFRDLLKNDIYSYADITKIKTELIKLSVIADELDSKLEKLNAQTNLNYERRLFVLLGCIDTIFMTY